MQSTSARRPRRGAKGPVLACLLLGPWLALAPPGAQAFPDKPMRIIIPYTPGGPVDLTVRLIQPQLEAAFGKPLVVEYKSGAGGAIGVQSAAAAKPDGYTLVVAATNNIVIDPFLKKGETFDPLRELQPLIKVAEIPAVLFTNRQQDAKNWEALRAGAARTGRVLNFGSPGVGTTPHLSSILLAKATGLPITHIAYRGAQPAVQALMANEVQLFMGAAGLLAGQVQSGQVVPLAVSAPERLAVLPDVPTVKEAGLPDVLANNWLLLAAPKGLPRDVAERIERVFGDVLRSEESRSRYAAQGIVPSGRTGAPLLAELRAEAGKWRTLIRSEGLEEGQ